VFHVDTDGRSGIIGTAGVWTNVTPAGADLTVGANSALTDPTKAGRMFAQISGSTVTNGVYVSLDYGATWTIANTTMNGQIAIAPNGTLYEGGIAGGGLGFYRSTDQGVTWTNFSVPWSTQDVYPPTVDPNDSNHLLICRHENDGLAESTDGGTTWSTITLNSGQLIGAGTAFCFFLNTGTPSTTRTTWLWCMQASAPNIGTWKTTNSGGTWTKVDKNEHPHGNMQIFQPDTTGKVFMGGIDSDLGQGVLYSSDYGGTWTHEANPAFQGGTISGTPNNLYSFYGPGGVGPAYQTAPYPDGLSGWTQPTVPMTCGAAQLAAITDGRRWAVLAACWNQGLWRWIES